MLRPVRQNLSFISALKGFRSDQVLHLANKVNYPLFLQGGVCIPPRWIRVIAIAGALVVFEAHALCSTTLGASPTPLSNFVVNNDGTVTHSKTGLIWKRCEEGQSGSSCEIGASQVFTWFDALAVAKDSAFSGNNDWRLPSKQELMSIVDETCFFPSINELVFPNTAPRSVWSSTTITAFPANAWFVEFGYASSGHGSKLSSVARNGVRLVRGEQVFDALVAVAPPDNVAPDTTITTAPSSSTATTASIAFSGTDDVGVTGFECSLDGAAFAACTSPVALTVLSAGAHNFQVRALDAAGNKDASPASVVWSVLALGGQAITFGAAPALTVGGAGAVSATSGTPNSGNAIIFTSLTPTICSVTGATVSATAAGICTIAANQAGNANYAAAPQVTQTITVGLILQTVTITPPPATVPAGTLVTLVGASSAGLPVTYTSLTPAICSVAGAVVTPIAAGTCTIAANQAGNATTRAADQVTAQFVVPARAPETVAAPVPALGVWAMAGLGLALVGFGAMRVRR
jgi:hypothetical protein